MSNWARYQKPKSSRNRVCCAKPVSPVARSRVSPDDLVWYQGEPGWQEKIDQARLQHDLQSFELYVRYEDDLGINSSFVGRLKLLDVGLDIGWSVRGP